MRRVRREADKLFALGTQPMGYRGNAAAHMDERSDVFEQGCAGCGWGWLYRDPARLRLFGTRCTDFVGAAGPLLCSATIASELSARFAELDMRGVVLLPPRPGGRRQLECGEFRYVWPARGVDEWLDGSSIRIESHCPVCGRPREVSELPEKTVDMDDGTGELTYRIEQTGEVGVLIDENLVGDAQIFRFLVF